VSGQLHALTALLLGKEPPVLGGRRLGGPPVSLNVVAKRNIPVPVRNQTPVIQPDSYLD